jgi:ribonuclease HIII
MIRLKTTQRPEALLGALEEFGAAMNYRHERKDIQAGGMVRLHDEDSKVVVSVYRTGTVTVQGEGSSLLREVLWYLEERLCQAPPPGPPRIGTDESGKGDYFGHLVVAGVFVDSSTESVLRRAGVVDCKFLSDKAVFRIEREIAKVCPAKWVSIGPARYNELYERLRNVNAILAWAHARVIKDLAATVSAEMVITDKFAPELRLRRALSSAVGLPPLVQRPRAEDDLAVAAASVVARATFLRSIEALSKRFEVALPRGASDVEDVAVRLVRSRGPDVLREVAKTHFRTTQRVLERAAEVSETK